MSLVALIPARGGSVRIPRKNLKPLGGVPLISHTIRAAQASGIFTDVIVSTEDAEIAAVAEQEGATIHLRAESLATSDAPDIGWMRAVLIGRREDAYAILRPTSPFRGAATIQRAWQQFQSQQPCDSLRAVERSTLHPAKMWFRRTALLPGGTSDNPMMGSAFVRERLVPVLPYQLWWDTDGDGYRPTWGRPGTIDTRTRPVPWHSCPTQILPEVWVQNASLEMGWRYNVLPPSLTVAGTYEHTGTISGDIVAPFFTLGWEGFDLNTPEDWARAEAHVADNMEDK